MVRILTDYYKISENLFLHAKINDIKIKFNRSYNIFRINATLDYYFNTRSQKLNSIEIKI